MLNANSWNGASSVHGSDQAVRYLATECAPINPDPIALEAEWNTAVGRRAAPNANADGQPSRTFLSATKRPSRR